MDRKEDYECIVFKKLANSPDAVFDILEIVEDKYFSNRDVFNLAIKTAKKGDTIFGCPNFSDPVVLEWMRLQNLAPTDSSWEYACEQLRDEFNRKSVIMMFNSVHAGTNLTQLREMAKSAIDSIEIKHKGGAICLKDIGKEVMEQIVSGQTGIPYDFETGIDALDEFTGLRRRELVFIGARPSIGKTTLAVNFIDKMIEAKAKGIFYSFEMSAQLIGWKLATVTTNAEARDIGNQYQAGDKASDTLSSDLLYIYEEADEAGLNSALSTEGIFAETKRIKNKIGEIDYIVIDYLTLIKMPRMGNMSLSVAQVAKDLKRLAKAFNCSVICLAQLSRDGEGTMPSLAHLKESGGIEEAADQVFFLHRDRKKQLEDKELITKAAISVAKNRNGACGLARTMLNLPTGKFTSFDGQEVAIYKH